MNATESPSLSAPAFDGRVSPAGKCVQVLVDARGAFDNASVLDTLLAIVVAGG